MTNEKSGDEGGAEGRQAARARAARDSPEARQAGTAMPSRTLPPIRRPGWAVSAAARVARWIS